MAEGNFDKLAPATDREFGEPPEDAGFAYLMRRSQELNPGLAHTLAEISRKKEVMKIITDELNAAGYQWSSLLSLSENPEIARKFGHLISFWDAPVNGQPKTEEQKRQEAKDFARSLDSLI